MLLRWLSVGVLLAAAPASTAAAQVELVHPRCAPRWWNAAAVAAAMDVELGAAQEQARITFVVDAPCTEQTIVSVLVQSADGMRRRSIDVGDVPESARARAIGMGVAALMRRPPEGPTEAPAETVGGEPSSTNDASDTADAPDAAETIPVLPDVRPETDPRERESPPEVEEPQAAAELAESAQPAARSPGPRHWWVRIGGVGLWSAPGSPWFGAGGALEWRARERWTLGLGVDGARAEASDPLGTVRGRWVSAALTVAWSHRWPGLSLGIRAGLTLDWLRLIGRSNREGVRTDVSHRWNAAAELTATLGIPVADRVELIVDLGAHLSPWGLGARSPSGRVLAMRNASGLARLGIRVRLGR